MSIKRQLAARARALGCCGFGVTAAGPVADHARFHAWLRDGYGADMGALTRDAALRADPRRLLPEARSVVAVAVPYSGCRDPGAPAPPGLLCSLAVGRDYHRVVRDILTELAGLLDGNGSTKAAVDTAPVLERSLAVAAGLGAVGRHTQLIVPCQGSRVVLGVLLTELALEPDRPRADDPCGVCRECLDACPTGALRPDGRLDARLCLSYWTTATRQPIPRPLRRPLGNRLYGCDTCLDACPHNAPRLPRLAPPAALHGDAHRSLDQLHALLGLGQRALRRALAGTALDWLHRTTLLRTVCVLLGNARDPASAPALTRALGDRAPEIRAHAAWALGELGVGRDHLRAALARETDPTARHEMTLALEGSESD
ncbi:MAG: tRNA epoxyqueuosine(34) reductase QueG [bacterium]